MGEITGATEGTGTNPSNDWARCFGEVSDGDEYTVPGVVGRESPLEYDPEARETIVGA